jgi:branched-chain amino acid transport system ATP-binding protein
MLSIARALMTRPELLLVDEPLEGLAPVIREMLMRVFEQLAADRRRTVVLVEQHVGLALAFADRAVLLDNGRIVFDGAAAALRDDPSLLHCHVGVGLAH